MRPWTGAEGASQAAGTTTVAAWVLAFVAVAGSLGFFGNMLGLAEKFGWIELIVAIGSLTVGGGIGVRAFARRFGEGDWEPFPQFVDQSGEHLCFIVAEDGETVARPVSEQRDAWMLANDAGNASAALSPFGKLLAVSRGGQLWINTVARVDGHAIRWKGPLPIDGSARVVAVTPAGHGDAWVALGMGGKLQVVRLSELERAPSDVRAMRVVPGADPEGHAAFVSHDLLFIRDGKIAAYDLRDGKVRAWESNDESQGTPPVLMLDVGCVGRRLWVAALVKPPRRLPLTRATLTREMLLRSIDDVGWSRHEKLPVPADRVHVARAPSGDSRGPRVLAKRGARGVYGALRGIGVTVSRQLRSMEQRVRQLSRGRSTLGPADGEVSP